MVNTYEKKIESFEGRREELFLLSIEDKESPMSREIRQTDSHKYSKDTLAKQSTKRDIWTNAVFTEIDKESEPSTSTIHNSYVVNISVSRNHLKLNILLRILMVLLLVANVAFMPWLRDKK